VDDLAAWLTEIWDEEERLARDADVKQDDPVWWVSRVAMSWPQSYTVRSRRDNRPIARIQDVAGDEDSDITGILDGGAASAHIAYHDPASVLARIAADRQILTRCTDYLNRHFGDDFSGDGLAEDVVKGLALPYADRPGYQEAWKPEA
jgi:hypothetical protein